MLAKNTAICICVALGLAASTPSRAAGTVSPFYPVMKRAVLGLYEGRDPTESNYLTVINNGVNALILRLHLARTATKSIDIQTFIYRYDDVGRLLMYELIQAARRGVKVRLIVDHLASDRDRGMTAYLATVHPNLEIRHYRPVAGRMEPSRFQETVDAILPTRTNQRMHNKLFVVDELIGITGGRNIEDSYYNDSIGMNFKDRDVMVIGPVATDMHTSFNTYWRFKHAVPSRDLKDIATLIEQGEVPAYDSREAFGVDARFDTILRAADDGDYIKDVFVKRLVRPARTVLLVDEPGKNNRWHIFSGGGRITQQLEEVFHLAEETIVMQSPYLVLDAHTRRFFKRMRRANPALRIIASSNSFSATDSVFAYSANYRLRSSYVGGIGMEVYEYRPHPADLLRVLPEYPELKARARDAGADDTPFVCLHAKTFVIDNRHTFIGSFNMDPRSRNLNTEVGLLIDDAVIATWIRNDIMRDCVPSNSWVINRRRIPLGLDAVNALFEGTLRHTPADIWPFRNTTSFDLIPGKRAVLPSHPDFYEHYREAGDLPGARGVSSKAAATLVLKAMGSPLQALF